MSVVYVFYRSDNPSPLITGEYLARQRTLLLPGQYAREHENQWVDHVDAFASSVDVDHAMAHGWIEPMQGRSDVGYVMYVDLGVVHDPTVIAIGHREGERVFIDKLVTFYGSREAPVQLEAVAQAVRDLAGKFRLKQIRIESWQGLMAVQSLQRVGLNVELFTPTAKSNSEEWPTLAQALTTRRLVLPKHAALREELINLVVEMTATGVRVVDRGSVHQDHAVAVRGVVAALMSQPVIVGFPEALGVRPSYWHGANGDEAPASLSRAFRTINIQPDVVYRW